MQGQKSNWPTYDYQWLRLEAELAGQISFLALLLMILMQLL
jgi:hypothetical protein